MGRQEHLESAGVQVNATTLSWIIGCCNPISALLVGPVLGVVASPRWARRSAAVGWVVLATAQAAFVAFAATTGYGGFRWAQALMIPVTLLQFTVWVLMIKGKVSPSAGSKADNASQDVH